MGDEKKEAIKLINLALEVAKNSTCQKSKCGSVIVQNEEIIGEGFNTPPNNQENQRRCNNKKDSYHNKVTDKTCCVHAEQRAIMNALMNNPTRLKDSTLYFVRLDQKGNLSFAGKPYCTICSKMALDVGIKYFILYHENGVASYDTDEYNSLSYQYSD